MEAGRAERSEERAKRVWKRRKSLRNVWQVEISGNGMANTVECMNAVKIKRTAGNGGGENRDM